MNEYLELKLIFQEFVRQFGSSQRQTPCGQNISPSVAHALMLLAKQENHYLSQKDMCAQLKIDKSNVARVCDTLLKKGWAKRTKSKEDKRAFYLELTKKGSMLAEKLEISSNIYLQKILDQISPNRRTVLMETLKEFAEACSKVKEEDGL